MLYKFYKSVFAMVDKKAKIRFILIIGLSIISSMLETITISSIFPFMSIVTDPNKIYSNKYYSHLYHLVGFSSQVNFIVFFGVFIIALFAIKTLFSSFVTFVSYSIGHEITKNIHVNVLSHFLSQKYIYYLRENKSYLLELLNNVNHIPSAITCITIIVSEFFIIILMYAILIFFNWKVMLAITMFLGVIVLCINKFIRPKMAAASHAGWHTSALSSRYITGLVSNYKIIKLIFNKDKYISDYEQIKVKQHAAEAKRVVLDRQPKNILELGGFVIMIGFVLYQEIAHGLNSSTNLIPMISLLMLAFYRLLPSLSRIIDAQSTILHLYPVIANVNAELNKKNETPPANAALIALSKRIQLDNIQFSYNHKKQVLSGISLTINKGEHVAFIGESGSGKSTLIDIIMGYYDSENELYKISGQLIIDGCVLADHDLAKWRRNIGYIPQDIYLFDGTVAENVVMNNDFDEEQVILALKKASIWEFLEHKEGIYTLVGDGGVMLSGGQKQRVGIARALYNNPEIIIMDEATSALDDDTESQIIAELNNFARDKTIIMIAHRLSSLKNCDKIYKLSHGAIVNEYENINEIN